ncbi:DnaA regulatory inactivator Hda [compost metagenome]
MQLSIEPLDDDAKSEVLRRKAAARGIDLPADVIHYLMSRGSRDLSTLLETLEAIRMAALTAKRRITVPLAREVLAGE